MIRILDQIIQLSSVHVISYLIMSDDSVGGEPILLNEIDNTNHEARNSYRTHPHITHHVGQIHQSKNRVLKIIPER